MEMWIVWILLLLGFLILEGLTNLLVSIWFCVGSVAGLFTSLFVPDNIPLQVLFFGIFSLLTLLGLRPFVRKYLQMRYVPTNSDVNIGKLARVTKKISPEMPGRAELGGKDWSARCDLADLRVGDWGEVIAIEGVTLVLQPAARPI